MERTTRNIVVNGQYIARMHVDTQIFCSAPMQINYATSPQQCADAEQTDVTTPDENAKPQHVCEYIHRENLRKQGLYSLDEFEQMIVNAVKLPSTQFADFLKKYKKQGNLDFHGQSKKQIFEYFRKNYPQMRAYEYNTFAAAF